MLPVGTHPRRPQDPAGGCEASLRGRPPYPSLLINPLDRSLEPLRGTAGTCEAIHFHLVDALSDDDRRDRGSEAALQVEGCRVRCMRSDFDGSDDVVGQGDGHGDGRGEAPVLTDCGVDAVCVQGFFTRCRSRTGDNGMRG